MNRMDANFKARATRDITRLPVTSLCDMRAAISTFIDENILISIIPVNLGPFGALCVHV